MVLKDAPSSLMADRSFLVAARQILAEQHLSLPQEEQEELKYQMDGKDNSSYYGSLNAALADGATALLTADFLVGLDDQNQPLSHRALLPPEAFYEGPIWRNFGRKGVLIVALSYMWATADHPDPDGATLKGVATFLRWIKTTTTTGDFNAYKDWTIVVFWDWGSLHQDKPYGTRSDEHTALFKSGLRNVNLWWVWLHG